MTDEIVDGGTNQTTAVDSADDTVLTQVIPDEGAGGDDPSKVADKVGEEGGAPKKEGEDKTNSDGAEPKKGEDAKDTADPQAYDFKVPDGMVLDTDLVEKVSPILKAKGFSQEEAQQLVDLYAGKIAAQAQAQQEAWKGQLQTWRQEIQEDPEFGGTKYQATVRDAQTVIARFGDDKLKAELKAFGIGNMPSLIRMLARAGRGMREDNFHGAGGAQGVDDTPVEFRMYPSMRPKN